MLLGENSDHIHEVFGIDVQYQVPRYQRRYVWNKTNWGTLWEDILAQLDPKLKDKDRGHFTGNIVIRSIKEGQLNRFEIIDGQQRLTTFQIIFCVIRDICQSQGHQELVDESIRHLVNTDTVIRKSSSAGSVDPTFKFLPTDYDKSAFKALVEGKYGKAGSQAFAQSEKISRNILNAYDYFKEMIIDYAGTDCDKTKVGDLITSIKSDFQLIQITIASSNQSEKIFESLNATGRMLSEFDYLRNNLFLRAGDKKDDNGKFYRDLFYEKYWHFENDSHYWDADTLELFFRAFLMAQLGPACVEAKNVKPFGLYREYRKTLTNKQGPEYEFQQLEYEFQQLQEYAESYKELNNEMNEPTSEIGIHMQCYEDLNLSSLDSFILFIKHGFGNELIKVCAILESYIVRRLLCLGSKKDTHANINKVSYAKIKKFFSQAVERSEFSAREFAEFLSAEWPNDEQVRAAFKQAESKDADFISYIFHRMKHWKQEEATSYGEDAPLDLKEQVTYLSEIQENLTEVREDESKLLGISRTFNEIWVPSHFFESELLNFNLTSGSK